MTHVQVGLPAPTVEPLPTTGASAPLPPRRGRETPVSRGATGPSPTADASDCRVGAVMLTWNQREMTLQGIASVLAADAPDLHLVLVDNGSTDGTVEAVRQRFPRVTCLPMGTNLGFCAANNRGAEWLRRHLDPDYTIFLNNDIEVDPQMFRHLTGFMRAHPRAGACGPLTFYHEAPDVVWGAGGRIYADLCWFPPSFRGQRDRGWQRPRRVDWVHGCALMVSRAAIDAIGLFDERFFIYHDEVDWCWRLRQAGLQTWVVPRARMWHKVTQAVGLHSPMMIYYTARNKFLFWWKHGRALDLGKFAAFHLVKAVRIFARQHSPWAVVSLGKACLDAVRGAFGQGHLEAARPRPSSPPVPPLPGDREGPRV